MSRRRDRCTERVLIAAIAVVAIACGRSDPAHLKVSALTDEAAPAPSTRADVVRVRYQLRNVGGRPLGIEGIAPACGCRPDSRLPESLAPGATTMLDLECHAPGSAGETIRELRLRTTDPLHPETTLRVALQRPSAGPSPAALYFGYVQVGESATRDVVLPVAVAAESLVSPRPELAVEMLPARSDGMHAVRVRFSPRAPGIVRAALELGAGGALPVAAVGYDHVMAFPAEVALPEASGASGLPAVTLVGVDDDLLANARVDYPPGISGEARVVTPGRQIRLLLRRGRGTPGAAGPAAIRVYGGSRNDPLLTIPVVGDTTGPTTAPPA